jgi:hypothetical protein
MPSMGRTFASATWPHFTSRHDGCADVTGGFADSLLGL